MKTLIVAFLLVGAIGMATVFWFRAKTLRRIKRLATPPRKVGAQS